MGRTPPEEGRPAAVDGRLVLQRLDDVRVRAVGPHDPHRTLISAPLLVGPLACLSAAPVYLVAEPEGDPSPVGRDGRGRRGTTSAEPGQLFGVAAVGVATEQLEGLTRAI